MGRNQERHDKRSTHLDLMCWQVVCMKTDETPLTLDVRARVIWTQRDLQSPLTGLSIFAYSTGPSSSFFPLLQALFSQVILFAGVNYSKISKQIYHQISAETFLLQKIFSCLLALLHLEIGSHSIKKVIKCYVFSHLRLDIVLNYVSTRVYIILKCDPSNTM